MPHDSCTGGCILRPGQYVFAARLDALPSDGLLVMVSDGEYRFATRDQTIASVCILAGDDGKPMVCVLPASDPELGLYDDGSATGSYRADRHRVPGPTGFAVCLGVSGLLAAQMVSCCRLVGQLA